MDDEEYLGKLIKKAARTLDDVADDVRKHMSGAVENIIKAGQALQEGRDMHPSNNAFHMWCEEEFPDLHRNTRTSLMQVGRRFDAQNFVQQFPVSVLYELAAPSVPDELVEEFLSSEEPVKVKDVKEAKKGYKQVTTKPTNSDLKQAVDSGAMRPTQAAREANRRANQAVADFNSMSDEEKVQALGGEKKLSASEQRKLDETLEEDFNPYSAALAVLTSLSRLSIHGGREAIEQCVMERLMTSPRMQKYEAEGLILLAEMVNDNYETILSLTQIKPNLTVVE